MVKAQLARAEYFENEARMYRRMAVMAATAATAATDGQHSVAERFSRLALDYDMRARRIRDMWADQG